MKVIFNIYFTQLVYFSSPRILSLVNQAGKSVSGDSVSNLPRKLPLAIQKNKYTDTSEAERSPAGLKEKPAVAVSVPSDARELAI